MEDHQASFQAVLRDERYQRNLDWGAPRAGHPEGTIRAHIEQLEQKLERLRSNLSENDYWKLRLLVHTHDTFKGDAQRGVAITEPNSHASLARKFLELHCSDPDLMAMVQYHDEPFALWRQLRAKGSFDQNRFASLLTNIKDWDLFLMFIVIDGCTTGKNQEPLRWFLNEVSGKVTTRWPPTDFLQKGSCR